MPVQAERPNLHCSPSIIMLMKSRKIRGVEHVTDMDKRKNVYRVLVVISENEELARRRNAWVGKY